MKRRETCRIGANVAESKIDLGNFGPLSAFNDLTSKMRSLLAVVLVGAISAAVGARSHRPKYDLKSLPVFFHSSNSTGPFNDAAIAEIAKFSIATVEKFQGTCWQTDPSAACDQVSVIEAQLARIKAANPNISTIVYFNSIIDFPQYKLHGLMEANPDYRLCFSNGTVIPIHGDHISDAWIFNYPNEGIASAIIDACTKVVSSGSADGCFMDRSVDGFPTLPNASHNAEFDAAHTAALVKMQSNIGDGLLIANHAYTLEGTGSAMVEECSSNADAFSWLNASVVSGKLVECHVPPSKSCGCAPGCASRDNALAMFLTLMPASSDAARAYFGCGPWLDDGAELSANGWQADYDYPLGEPLAPAKLGPDNKLHRAFESGTTVTYDPVAYSGSITWAK
jgi:hypothetical protein